MAAIISDAGTLPVPSQGIALSTDGIVYDIIPVGPGTGTTVSGIFGVVPDWNGNGQGGTPGMNYPYPTKTILVIQATSGTYKCELQDLKGGTLYTAGYNNGTNGDLAAAIQTVNTWG